MIKRTFLKILVGVPLAVITWLGIKKKEVGAFDFSNITPASRNGFMTGWRDENHYYVLRGKFDQEGEGSKLWLEKQNGGVYRTGPITIKFQPSTQIRKIRIGVLKSTSSLFTLYLTVTEAQAVQGGVIQIELNEQDFIDKNYYVRFI